MDIKYTVTDASMNRHTIGQFSSRYCADIFAKAYAKEYETDLKRNQIQVRNDKGRIINSY